MRIGLDGYNIAMATGTGVATFGLQLALANRGMGHDIDGVFGLPVPSDPLLRETAFFDAFQRTASPKKRQNRYQRGWQFLRSFPPPRLRQVPLSAAVEKSSFQGKVPDFDRIFSAGDLFDNAFTSFALSGQFVELRVANPPAIMHWTYPLPLMFRGSRNIYTLHDLVPLKLPYTTLDNKTLYARIVAHCVKTAAQLCTVSESSSRDLIDRYNLNPARVTNTYQTASTSVECATADSRDDAYAVEGIFGLLHRGYFLYFGAIEPKKNVGRLIEAYLSLQTTTPLVIVGARAWQSEQELRLMPGGGGSGAAGTFQGHRGQTIVRLDYLSHELLVKLIRCAKAVVFPSLYEGFGLPVLEAMQLGTPVITSNTSSLPEVAGNAGLLIDPYDVASLREAMRRLDIDDLLCQMMSARGIEQAKLFSRERYQERLTELYRAAMAPR